MTQNVSFCELVFSLLFITLPVKSGSIIIQIIKYSSRNGEEGHQCEPPTYGDLFAFLAAKSFLKPFLIIYPITISQLSVMYMDS
jgi:hypothetical protein